MTSPTPGRVAQTLGFRLAFWYAAIFTVSVLVIAAIAYALLARSLTQRDHDLIRVKLADYAARFESAGVAGVSRAVAAEQASGSEDQVFVRLVGANAEILLTSMPASWGSYALEQLGDGEGWRIVPARGAPVRLEVATERLVDGTILQVGRTTLERERFLRDRPRAAQRAAGNRRGGRAGRRWRARPGRPSVRCANCSTRCATSRTPAARCPRAGRRRGRRAQRARPRLERDAGAHRDDSSPACATRWTPSPTTCARRSRGCAAAPNRRCSRRPTSTAIARRSRTRSRKPIACRRCSRR